MFNLFEILISFFLLAILLLGADALALFALKKSKTIYYGAVAHQQLNELIERLQATKGKNPETILKQWNQHNKIVLPKGHGVIKGVFPLYNVMIFWGSFKNDICQKIKVGEAGCIPIQINL